MSVTGADSGQEYGRPPVYQRPPARSLVQAIQRVLQGETQTDAMKEVGNG